MNLKDAVRHMVDERERQKRAKAIERAEKNLGDAIRNRRKEDEDYWRGRLAALREDA